MHSAIFRVLLIMIVFGVLQFQVEAKSWRRLTPLRSSRKDVVRLLNLCADKTTQCKFTLGEEVVEILFSDDVSENYHPCIKKLPEGTVMLVSVKPLKQLRFIPAHLPKHQFKVFNPSEPPSPAYSAYLDEKNGIVISTYQGNVLENLYLATRTDALRCPSYYEDPESIVQIGTFTHSPRLDLRCPTRVKAGDVIELKAFIAIPTDSSEPLYLWDISIGVPFSGQRTKTIKIDSSALADKTITASVKVGAASAGCTIRIEP